MSQSGERDVLVKGKRQLADGVVLLSLADLGGGALPAWEPGAHIDVVLRPDLIRQYSLCGDPSDPQTWQVAVLREPDGRGGSRHVHDELAEGSTLRVRGPRNNFAFAAAPRYVFIAGGIGITPILPMVAAAQAAGAEWTLLYGGRTRSSMAFREELLSGYGDRVSVCPQDETGLLDLAPLLDTPRPDTLVYCCGPEPLLAAVERACAAWPAGSLRTERFTPPEQAAEPVLREAFEVRLERSGITVSVPPDKSILEAVEEQGVEPLYACREGTCGSCETPVLEGVPDHRDWVLTEEERAANDKMMLCVSRAACPRLVLDL